MKDVLSVYTSGSITLSIHYLEFQNLEMEEEMSMVGGCGRKIDLPKPPESSIFNPKNGVLLDITESNIA